MATTFDDVLMFIQTLGPDYRMVIAQPADRAAIAAAETRLGFALPPDYRDFIERCGALHVEVIEEIWRRLQEWEIRPMWQMCHGLWVHGIADHPDLSLMAQRQPGFAPVLRIAGLGLREAVGYDDVGRLVSATESGLAPAGKALAEYVLDAVRQLATHRERLRTEPIAPPEPASATLSTVALKLQASPDALPTALRRVLDELGGTFQVEVSDDDAEYHPAELDAFATQTNDALLSFVLEGREFNISAIEDVVTGAPLQVFIQSVVNPTSDPVASAAMGAFERALAAMGPVVERFENL